MSLLAYRDYLAHHGIKGQKWGIRRFQNEDGSLTQQGRERYGLDKLDMNAKYTGPKSRAVKEYQDELEYRRKKWNEGNAKTESEYTDFLLNKRYKGQWHDQDDVGDLMIDDPRTEKDKQERQRLNKEVDRVIGDYLKSKYGQETIDKAKKRESFKQGSDIVGAILLAPLVLNPIGLPVSIAVTNAQDKKRNEKLEKKYGGK